MVNNPFEQATPLVSACVSVISPNPHLVISNQAAPDISRRRSATWYILSGSTALLAGVSCLTLWGALAGAQQPTNPPSSDTSHAALLAAIQRGSYETRANLEKAAAGTGLEATAAKERLANGDFQVGDRIALSVAGEAALTDTFTVREGQILRLPQIPDVALHGVLHSELQDTLTHVIARYIREPDVRATALVRLAVVGQVQRPGYYSAPADALLSDMVARAGGATTNSNLNKTIIRRNGTQLLNSGIVSYALANGQTIDQLSLRPGDEIVVGSSGQGSALTVLYIIGAVLGIFVSIAFLARH
jgi:protein involved in polysaccharide export with SLBB domain